MLVQVGFSSILILTRMIYYACFYSRTTTDRLQPSCRLFFVDVHYSAVLRQLCQVILHLHAVEPSVPIDIRPSSEIVHSEEDMPSPVTSQN